MNRNTYPLTLFYDGACAICKLEMDDLRSRNALNRLVFVDISQPGFDPAWFGVSLQDMGALLHGQRADGSLVVGTETIRLAYRAVGLGHLTAPTGLPFLKPVFDAAYAVFARNRYAISGVLLPVIERIAAARALRRSQACAHGACDATGTRRTS
ncbi:MAG: DUF393 domain-containing protein [Pseudomonadota bacterium]